MPWMFIAIFYITRAGNDSYRTLLVFAVTSGRSL
jgi:hypothetical protein